MNDADLGDAVEHHTKFVDGLEPHHEAHAESQLNRWWFASAAFPMIAGTLGPVASAFSICALVRPWRMHIPPGLDVTKADFVDDPEWLTIVNAVQLAIALIANMFLLLNMAKRVRFSIAQPITIAGWYISSVALLALVSTAAGPLVLEPVEEYVWSQAWYYGMFSAIIYFIVASLMVVTFWGAHVGHYDKDFDLTLSQRTLMLQTIMLLIYLLLGACIFGYIEGWNYLDAVYWANVTLFTVGFGDLSPQTSLGRGLLVPYAFVGITSLGLVIGSIRSLVLDRGKHRMDARMLEKKRRQMLRRVTHRGKEAFLEPIKEPNAEDMENMPRGRRYPGSELERREFEFELMRRIQEKAAIRRRWTALGISLATWIGLWLIGAYIFQSCEYPYQNWTYFDGFYFAFVGLTTIGYGDVTPVSPGGKAFFVFWALLALPTMTVLISNAGETVVKVVRDATDKLGNLTILPGERGFKKELKLLLAQLSFGAMFKDEDKKRDEEEREEPHELVPGIIGASQPVEESTSEGDDDDDDDETGGERTPASPDSSKAEKQVSRDSNSRSSSTSPPQDPEAQSSPPHTSPPQDLEAQSPAPHTSAARTRSGKGPSLRPELDASPAGFGPPKRAATFARQNLPKMRPSSRHEYHLVLIDEISRVTQHLRHQPPRKYDFHEWAYYLLLLGEDENNAETHRKPSRKREKDPNAQPEGEPGEESENGRGKWSWVGLRSPLMDSKEEAEWILEKLTQRLKHELENVLTEQEGPDVVRRTRLQERKKDETGVHQSLLKGTGL